MRRADLRYPFFQFLDFVRCPPAETVSLRIIAAPKFLALAADRALGTQIVITALKLVQFELERRVSVGTPDIAAQPVLPRPLTVL